jgi:hypothetical protein
MRPPQPPHRWSPGRKLLLAVLTAWGPVYILLFFLVIAVTVLLSGGELGSLFYVIFVVHMLTILLGFVLIAAYVYDAFHNPRIVGDRRALWAVVLFLGSLFAMPVYWWLYVRPEADRRPAQSPPA